MRWRAKWAVVLRFAYSSNSNFRVYMQQLECVLLVDDDEITNFVHESLIDDLGFAKQVLVAKNGQEAIQIIRQQAEQGRHCPNLTFMDINMPVMNGFEFLEAYQQLDEALRQSIIIVMLTTSLNPKDIERTKNRGVADFLNKPLTAGKVREVLAKHFEIDVE